jgi:hypothetical protein
MTTAERDALEAALLPLAWHLAGSDQAISGIVLEVLGSRPDGVGPEDKAKWLEVGARICVPNLWPEDLEGLTYFYRELHRLVRTRRETGDCATSIRRDLQNGTIRAVLIMEDGTEKHIEPTRWRGSKELWWSGWEVKESESSGEPLRGKVYIVTPTSNRDAAPAAPDPTPRDLGERERDTYRKLILGMAMAKYRYPPNGAYGSAVSNIVHDLQERGLELSDDTIRNKLKDALEVYDPAKDQKIRKSDLRTGSKP